MTASNDNRRARNKRGRTRGPESAARMARVLAEIYAHPPAAIINSQCDLIARLDGDQAPTAHGLVPGVSPATEEAGR